MPRRKGSLAALWALATLGIASPAVADPKPADPAVRTADSRQTEFFEKEIRPILVERCQSCHGDKMHKGGLRLTSRDAALRGADGGPVIVPGKPSESRLVRAIEYAGELKMPPTGKLPDRDIVRLQRWVADGAVWPQAAKAGASAEGEVTPRQRDWWAFRPVRPVAPPAVRNGAWPRTEIDRFVLAELENRGLAPAAPADRRVLLRRATFDLTGLPPTPEDFDAFAADASDDAFARVVDRLLNSPAYGQRWARHWLDVARYT